MVPNLLNNIINNSKLGIYYRHRVWINITIVFVFRYYKCNKAQSHFCPGAVKILLNGTIVLVKLHNEHG